MGLSFEILKIDAVRQSILWFFGCAFLFSAGNGGGGLYDANNFAVQCSLNVS